MFKIAIGLICFNAFAYGIFSVYEKTGSVGQSCDELAFEILDQDLPRNCFYMDDRELASASRVDQEKEIIDSVGRCTVKYTYRCDYLTKQAPHDPGF